MSFVIETAKRKNAKLKIGVTAPSGGGKTWSSLQLAAGLAGGDWSKVCVLDTERSASLYADNPNFGKYNVINFDPPYEPNRYIEAINHMVNAGMEVAILDSISHEWQWCLEYQSKLGGRFQDWARVTPLHNDFIEAIVQAPIHLITTTRRKVDYEISDEGGKKKVTKVGLKQEMREGFDYEVTTLFALNQNNMAGVEKDRTGLFQGKPDFMITQETGKMLREWANSGAAIEEATYTGSNEDKIWLANECKRKNITDTEEMKKFHLIGTNRPKSEVLRMIGGAQ